LKEIFWTVQITNAPTVVRYCKRCSANVEFVSSGCFRVNAQQKSLDVWLIYKCLSCDATWNLTILSRVSPRSIPVDQLRGFYENDSELAIRYANDPALIKRQGGNPTQPEIEIVGPNVDPDEPVRIRITPAMPLNIKAEVVIRKKLSLSRGEFDKMQQNGTLVSVSGHDIKKCKLSGEIVFELRQSLDVD